MKNIVQYCIYQYLVNSDIIQFKVQKYKGKRDCLSINKTYTRKNSVVIIITKLFKRYYYEVLNLETNYKYNMK